MKTTYLKPEMDVLYYAAEQLMSASKPITETGGDLKETPETEATSGNLSRRKDIWADDEEEEEEMY